MSTGIQERQRRRILLPFIVPAVVLYSAILVVPTLYSVWISFQDWHGTGPMKYVGLTNYTDLFSDSVFKTALINTFVILVGVGALVFALSFALMMIMRAMPGRTFARVVLLFPGIISAVALSIAWAFLFNYQGMLNSILADLGIAPVAWLSPSTLFLVILAGLVWINTGFYATILLAGVDRIPRYLYEDASLGGARTFQQFRHITLPLSADVVSVAAILWTINSLKLFEFIYAFGGGSTDLPSPSSWNTALFVYAESYGGFSPPYDFGYASACAVVMLMLFAVFIVVLRRLLRRNLVEF